MKGLILILKTQKEHFMIRLQHQNKKSSQWEESFPVLTQPIQTVAIRTKLQQEGPTISLKEK